MPEARPVPPGLAPFWQSPLQKFAELQPNAIKPEEQERHRIYSLMLMGLVYFKWNGNKFGEIGDYGEWRADQVLGSVAESNEGEKFYEGGSYLGHNIAAIAVDAEGRIIDFDFNHNQVYDSTVEHAESRLVRRVFALNQVYDPWYALNESEATPDVAEGQRKSRRPYERRNVFATAASERPRRRRALKEAGRAEGLAAGGDAAAPVPYSTLLTDVTIYTSLESCAQCSGIMCLGSVKDIVYLQWDQGQFLVGNMMWQATTTQQQGFIAPRPIRGDEIGFKYFKALNDANQAFSEEVKSKPFYKGRGAKVPNNSPAVTSFLCTDQARAIYAAALEDLMEMEKVEFPDYRPIPTALSNEEARVEAEDFLVWAYELDNRGAPHRV